MVTWHYNHYKPDTCGCEFVKRWDEDLTTPQADQLVSVKFCPTHASIYGKTNIVCNDRLRYENGKYGYQRTIRTNGEITGTEFVARFDAPETEEIVTEAIIDSIGEQPRVENKRKNYALDEIATRLGLPEDDTRFTKLRQYIDNWYFDANRTLHIVSIGLTTNQKTAAQNAVNTRFGVGKIVIE